MRLRTKIIRPLVAGFALASMDFSGVPARVASLFAASAEKLADRACLMEAITRAGFTAEEGYFTPTRAGTKAYLPDGQKIFLRRYDKDNGRRYQTAIRHDGIESDIPFPATESDVEELTLSQRAQVESLQRMAVRHCGAGGDWQGNVQEAAVPSP
jgi:hypothetical protein